MSKRIKKNSVKRLDKETRKILEAISDVTRARKDGTFKIKAKRKEAKKVRRSCLHWVIRKGTLCSAVDHCVDKPDYWECAICHEVFPCNPLSNEDYREICDQFKGIVNQAAFYSIKLGGDVEYTRLFESLKKLIPMFRKGVINQMKHIRQAKEIDESRKKTDTMDLFHGYAPSSMLRNS